MRVCVCVLIFKTDTGNKTCGTPNGEPAYTNLGAKSYFMRILFGSKWEKHIKTKPVDRTDEVPNFNDPRFYSMIRLCYQVDRASDAVRKWGVRLIPCVAQTRNYRRDESFGLLLFVIKVVKLQVNPMCGLVRCEVLKQQFFEVQTFMGCDGMLYGTYKLTSVLVLQHFKAYWSRDVPVV